MSGSSSLNCTIPFDHHPTPNADPVQGLLNVFDAIDKNSFTLRTFLENAFNCQDPRITKSVNLFYGKHGPASITKLWISKRPKDANLVDVALQHVLSSAKIARRKV
ncbi:hypothetical protein BGZ58_010829 [Dissophora ornata]|nr:hypothetical protein BGZ58_010829 [Dissophora ornata]